MIYMSVKSIMCEIVLGRERESERERFIDLERRTPVTVDEHV